MLISSFLLLARVARVEVLSRNCAGNSFIFCTRKTGAFCFGLDAGQLRYSLKTEGSELASTSVIVFEIACLRQITRRYALWLPHPSKQSCQD
jgi:hypothetical protein